MGTASASCLVAARHHGVRFGTTKPAGGRGTRGALALLRLPVPTATTPDRGWLAGLGSCVIGAMADGP